MRRISKKKLLILFTIILVIVVIAISIGLSRALKKEIIQVNIVDSEGKISEESLTIEGIIDDSYHYIPLPRVANNYIIEKYYIDDSDLAFENGFMDADSYFNEEETNEENDTAKDTSKETTNDTAEVEDVEERGENGVLYPYDFLMLTPEQIESKAVTIKVKYDYIENEEGKIYKREITQDSSYSTAFETFESEVGIEAYAPEEVEVELSEVEQDYKEVLESNARSIAQSGSLVLYDVYDIQVNIDEENEFDWKEYQDTIKFKIKNLDDDYQYTLFKYDDIDLSLTEVDLIVEEVGVYYTEIEEEIENYVLMVDSSAMKETKSEDVIYIRGAGASATDVWDGSQATSFYAGSGTQADPYLITSGAELKYFQSRVAAGVTFANQYIMLVSNIDLNGRNWVPIGNNNASFKGHFDGTGLTISNAIISANNSRYGLFGAIGDSATRTTIRNLQISGFSISVTQNGNSFTVLAGCLVAEMYQNAYVENCIVKNSSITVTNSVTFSNYNRKFSFGGIAGRMCNTANNPEATPANTSNIVNCASAVNIDSHNYNMNNNNGNLKYTADCSSGGIVGSILYHGDFPQSCYYTGTLTTCTDFAGPIFGSMRSTTFNENGNIDTQFETYFNGNTSLVMTSYYGTYRIVAYTRSTTSYPYPFTSSITTGTTPVTIVYRASITDSVNNRLLKKKYEGVNKGTYTNNINNVLTMFNNTASATQGFLEWEIDANNQFSLKEPFTATVSTDQYYYMYTAVVSPAGTNYTYNWKIGNDTTNNGSATINVGFDYNNDRQSSLVVSDGTTLRVVRFTIPKSIFELVLDYDASANSLTGRWDGNGQYDTSRNDYNLYEWTWYSAELGEDFVEIDEGRTYSPVDSRLDYKLVATLLTDSNVQYEAVYLVDRNVVYVDATNGNNNYDGRTPTTAKKTMEGAYNILSSNGTIDYNVIVVIGVYSRDSLEDKYWMHQDSSTTYNKDVTITGQYRGINYNGLIPFTGGPANNPGSARYSNANMRFMYIKFDGGTLPSTVRIGFGGRPQAFYIYGSDHNQAYWFLQGYSLTMAKGVSMVGYHESNTNQGLYSANAPAFHIFGGWEQYDLANLPRNNPSITIKSGAYGRVILGGSNGVSSQQSLNNPTSHNFIGHSLTDTFVTSCTIDIGTSTKGTYDYDINLLVGGACTGNTYSNSTLTLNNGSVGRIIGGSIGDSSFRVTGFPVNTYIGTSTLNLNGGTAAQVYGASLGRVMSTTNPPKCDVFYYGIATVNITGTNITGDLFGAGAGAVTGYNSTLSPGYGDTYGATYSSGVTTKAIINMTGGRVGGSIYGGGYGYTNYLNSNTIQANGGSMYGDTEINISAGTVVGNVFGGGCGYNWSNVNQPQFASMVGNSVINITGNPTISGDIYGAGNGIQNNQNIAKFTGTTTINVNANLTGRVFGGGNYAPTVSPNSPTTQNGITIYPLIATVNINSGNHQGNIYGGGNLASLQGATIVKIDGTIETDSDDNYVLHQQEVYGGGKSAEVYASTVNVLNSVSKKIFGGGEAANVNTTTVNMSGGVVTENVYGGSNTSGTVQVSNVTVTGGKVSNTDGTGAIYGGNNAGGTTQTANVTYNNTDANGGADYVFGGGNQASTTTTNVYILNGTINQNVFGGGNEASTGTTNLTIKGGSAQKAFGGGNKAGVTVCSNVTAYSGTYPEIYGGSNSSGNVAKTIVRIKNTSDATNPPANGTQVFGDIYGANNSGGVTSDPNVYMDGGNVQRIFGGGNQATVPKTYVEFNNGTASEVFAGGNGSTATVTSTNGTRIVVNNGNITTGLYGGGNEAQVTYDTDVTINKGIIEKAFGGGKSALVDRETFIRVNSGKITQVFGGGNEAGVTVGTNVYLYGGKIYEAYGGSNSSGNVGRTYVNLYEPVNLTQDNSYSDFTYPEGPEVDENEDGIPDKYEFEGVDLRNYNIKFIFGGNNVGGITSNPNVSIIDGKAGNVFGGGNSVSVPRTTVTMLDGQTGNIFGGGNRDSVNNDTYVDIDGGIIDNNVYGGGNAGVVGGNTAVFITDTEVRGSAFAGGNGAEAIVQHNSTIAVDGQSIIGTDPDLAPKKGSVFGGGNAAGTGVGVLDENTGKYHGTAKTSVNIAGGTIYGNVYGGPYGGTETTKVYGSTGVYIGINAISNISGLVQDDVYIVGTIFGGGEANISGGSSFSSAFTSVTDGLEMIIDGTNYDNGVYRLDTTGSIFGSGNASHTEGSSNITIRNYGTIGAPKDNISIQRTTNLIIENSGIILKGTTDSTNDYADEEYSINRVENLYLCDNSTLYLNRGANLLQNWHSLISKPTTVDGDGKFIITNLTEIATINHYDEGVLTNDYLNENGQPIPTLTTDLVTQNVDNRIYLKEGITFNIAKNQDTSYAGGVYGMTYVGLFADINSPATTVGQYSSAYTQGATITNAGTFTKNATIKGEHKQPTHNIGVDGFFTTLNNEGKAKFEYVGVDPLDQDYYYWYIGENIDVTVYEITLQASKYATLGTGELLLDKHTAAGATFTLQGVTINMNAGKNLVPKAVIPSIAPTEAEANSNFGLAMKNGKKGIVTNGSTHFYVQEENGVPVPIKDGTPAYNKENSSVVPSFEFYLYHSQNITQKEDLGEVTIRIQCRYNPTPTTVEQKLIDIVVTLKSELFVDPAYETAITPGKEFELFTTTVTNVTNDGEFSNYFSLNITDFQHSSYYANFNTYKRYFISRDVNGLPYTFKQGTTFTLLDLVTNETYYYIVTVADETSNKFRYNIADFKKMGSTDEAYDVAASLSQYIVNEEDSDPDNDYVFEEYIVHVNFESATITQEAIGNTFFMELLNNDFDTIIGTLEPEKSNNYSIYVGRSARIDVSADLEKDIVYLGEIDTIDVTSNFTQSSIGGNIIYDTKYLEQQMGMRIVILDSNGTQLSSNSLVGMKFKFKGNDYYPRYDGSTRINIAEKVSNALTQLKLDLTDNTLLSTGTYTIRIEVFGSADGIYYGDQTIGYTEITIDIISGDYGLKVYTDGDEYKIVKSIPGTITPVTITKYDTADDTSNTADTADTTDTTDTSETLPKNAIPVTIEYSSSLENAKIIVSLQRRIYSQSSTHAYDLGYTMVDLQDYLASSSVTLQPFTGHQYLYIYNDDPEIEQGQIKATYTHTLYLKPNLTTGTYKIVYSIYDGDTFIGDESEYIVIN